MDMWYYIDSWWGWWLPRRLVPCNTLARTLKATYIAKTQNTSNGPKEKLLTREPNINALFNLPKTYNGEAPIPLR